MMKKLNLIFILLLLSGLFMPLSLQAQNQSYYDGLDWMKKGQYKEAISCFENSIALDKSPKNKKRCDGKIKECEWRIEHPEPKPDPKPKPNTLQIFADYARQEEIGSSGGDKAKYIPVDEEWQFKAEAKDWVSFTKYSDTLKYSCTPYNNINSTRSVKVWITSKTKKDYFTITQIGRALAPPGPGPNPDVLSFPAKKKGGKIIVPLRRNKEIIVPDGVDWCEKSEYKYKERNILQKIGNFFVKLLGGSPKLELCDSNEMVINVMPNAGGPRTAQLRVKGQNLIIEIKQQGY